MPAWRKNQTHPMRLMLIGHMTLRIELDGLALLTDPWFGPHGWLERWRAPRIAPPALSPEDIGNLDALLITHNHLDHVDHAAMDIARRQGCVIIGSHNVARRAKKAGVRDVIAVAPGDKTTLHNLTIHAVRAQHPRAADAVGFVMEGSQTCYFSGDTRFTPELAENLAPYTIDVALLQSACAQYWLLGADGMSLPEAAALARALRPRWTVPLHLGCAGRWLDRGKGLRVEKDNGADVRASLRRWATSLQDEHMTVRLLSPGDVWDVGD